MELSENQSKKTKNLKHHESVKEKIPPSKFTVEGFKILFVESDGHGFFNDRVPPQLENVVLKKSWKSLTEGLNLTARWRLSISIFFIFLGLPLFFIGIYASVNTAETPDGRYIYIFFLGTFSFLMGVIFVLCGIGRFYGHFLGQEKQPTKVMQEVQFYRGSHMRVILKRFGRIRMMKINYVHAGDDEAVSVEDSASVHSEEEELITEAKAPGRRRSLSANWYVKDMSTPDGIASGPYTMRTLHYWHSQNQLENFGVSLPGIVDEFTTVGQLYDNVENAFLFLPGKKKTDLMFPQPQELPKFQFSNVDAAMINLEGEKKTNW